MSARNLISIVMEDRAWKGSGVALARIRSAAELALACGTKQTDGQVAVLLANDAKLRALNARFRGKDAPTNVLSFPAFERGCYLGDVAIARETAGREAASSGITLQAHTLHLAVHGVLHLLGYDHVKPREAGRMERLEIAILERLGIANPYGRARAR